MEKLPIVYHDREVGSAQVFKEGLYYCINCQCDDMMQMCQIEVLGDRQTINLGTCVPINGGIGLRTRIAAKRLGTVQGFVLRQKGKKETRIPLIPEEAVKELQLIGVARLDFDDEQAVLLLDEGRLFTDGNKIADIR